LHPDNNTDSWHWYWSAPKWNWYWNSWLGNYDVHCPTPFDDHDNYPRISRFSANKYR
jgi:hypothetical protein